MRSLIPLRAAGTAVALLTVTALSGCVGGDGPATACVPGLAVSPSDPHPGRIVTVTTTRACPIDLPDGAALTVRIQPADARIPLAQASATPQQDGTLDLSISVPPTMPEGTARVWIVDYWDYADCPGTAECPPVEGFFDVGPNLN